MFTGIIEDVGKVVKINKQDKNIILTIQTGFVEELKINQSIAHNGACLSVTLKNKSEYTVCAIQETLNKTNISSLKIGSLINLERCVKLGDRLDGHIVQGHIDCVVKCTQIKEIEGSWVFIFDCPQSFQKYLIPQGSIAINGVSLTIAQINDSKKSFSVAIIPYTFKNTNFKKLQKDDYVNIEFDFIAKQIARMKSI